jgi:hypothetical protein
MLRKIYYPVKMLIVLVSFAQKLTLKSAIDVWSLNIYSILLQGLPFITFNSITKMTKHFRK